MPLRLLDVSDDDVKVVRTRDELHVPRARRAQVERQILEGIARHRLRAELCERIAVFGAQVEVKRLRERCRHAKTAPVHLFRIRIVFAMPWNRNPVVLKIVATVKDKFCLALIRIVELLIVKIITIPCRVSGRTLIGDLVVEERLVVMEHIDELSRAVARGNAVRAALERILLVDVIKADVINGSIAVQGRDVARRLVRRLAIRTTANNAR